MTSYVADYSAGSEGLNFGGYGGPLSDIDLSISRSPDKRLLGINATTTGEGSTVLQDIIVLGTAVAGVVAANAKNGVGPGGVTPCGVVREHFTGDSIKTPPSVSLTYSANIIYGAPSDPDATVQAPTTIPIEIDPETTASANGSPLGFSPLLTLSIDPGSMDLQKDLQNALQSYGDPFTFQLKSSNAYRLADDVAWADSPVPQKSDTGTEVAAAPPLNAVVLRRTFNTDLQISGPILTDSTFQNSPLWRGTVLVPTHSTYFLPLPTPEPFGKSQFTLSLTDAGTISKLEYGTTSGNADAIGTAAALAKAAQPASDATLAANVQGKADLIYEQQRLATCKASPTSCLPK